MKSLILVFLLAISTALYAQIPVEGLIAKYNFDEDANDQFNNYHGTLLGGATTDIFLTIGENAVDALSIPGIVLNSATEYSITHEVMFTNFNINHQWASNVIFSGASTVDDNLMNFAYAKNQLGSATLENTIFYVHDDVRYEFNNIDLSEGEWYHFALIRGPTTLKFYLNGVEQIPIGGITVPTLNLSLDPEGFIFGQDQDVLGGGFVDYQCLNGSMDNLMIYNRLLTSQEVLDIYNSIQVGVNSIAIDETIAYSIYPNHGQDILYIDNTNKPDPISRIELYDMLGNKLILSNNSIESIDISKLSSGFYIVSIMSDSGRIQRLKISKL